MMKELINETKKKESDFYLYDYEKLSRTIDFLEKTNLNYEKIIISIPNLILWM